MYILTEQLFADDEVTGNALERYKAYLASVRSQLPPGAYDLAASDWYHDFSDHRCPHDAWLETVTVAEVGTGSRSQDRGVEIAIRLLGAYHDGYIELRYRRVGRYRIELVPAASERRGHQDWRYDEFRLAAPGHFVHEIEWWGRESTGTWIIEAADVEYHWAPIG